MRSWVFLNFAALVSLAPVAPAQAQARLDQLSTRTAELEVSLGSFDHPVLAFSRTSGLTTDDAGRMYILQPMEGQVTVINPDGSLAYRFGRRGQGPGEFQAPSAVVWHGDTLVVADVAQQRASYFLRDTHIRTSRFDPPILRAGSQVAAQVPLPDGSVYTVVGRRFERPYGHPDNYLPILRQHPGGRSQDTVGVLRESYPFRLIIPYEGGTSYGSPLFSDFPLHHLDHHGSRLVIVDRPFGTPPRASVRVSVLRPTGDTIFSREYAVPVVPLTDREWNDRLTEALGSGARADRPFGRREVEAASVRPPHWPSATRVILGRNGWVWLGLTDHPSRQEVDWAVLDERGVPLFSVRMPQRFTPHVATEDRVWGVWTDEFDVPHVRRYRIR
jgi:hypothetical protein